MADFAPTGQLRSIFEAFKDAAWHTKYASYLLAAGLALSSSLRFFNDSETASQAIDRIVIIACLLLLLVGGLIRETQVRRDRRFATIQRQVHEILHRNRDLNTYLDSVINRIESGGLSDYSSMKDCENIAKSELTKILDSLSKAFSIVTGTSCRTSVKGIFEDNGSYFVYTIARDFESQSANAERDGERLSLKQDPIEENTDFKTITDKDTRDQWFFGNFLPKDPSYRNSQDPNLHDRHGSNSSFLQTVFPRNGWKLPYVASIVWPVQQKATLGLSFEPRGCIGFLTVDANRKKPFDHRFDTFLGAGVADALFHTISKLSELSSTIDATTMGEADAQANG